MTNAAAAPDVPLPAAETIIIHHTTYGMLAMMEDIYMTTPAPICLNALLNITIICIIQPVTDTATNTI